MKFEMKVMNDRLNKNKSFRLSLGDKIIGLGNMETLKKMDDENLGTFFTMVLNEALEILKNE